MRIVVLGAGGQLGQVIADRASARGHSVVAWTRAEADITKPVALAGLISLARPEVIFNCAAFSRVDEAEDDACGAFAVNALALRDLARLARLLNFVLVHYSTDFVFDGRDVAPSESHATNPRGVYATSKLVGEWFAAESPAHYILRVESLFGGPGGKGSVDTLLDGLLAGCEVRAFADRTVSPSFVGDVADASLTLVERRAPFGLYHCVNSGQTTWVDLARLMARLVGRAESLVVPVNMAGLTMRVPRPLNAALSNAKLLGAGISMPGWRDAIEEYVKSKTAR